MNGQEMRARMRNGQPVYGTMVLAFSPMWPSALKGAGLDFAFIDTEHVPQSRAELSMMCRLYAASDMVPVVRIPSPDPYQACMVLDGGAQGIIAPYIESVEQVRQLVGAVKYRPVKGEKLQKALSGDVPFEPELADYLEKRAAGNALIVNIESVPAMEALDDILTIQELDAVLIGPHDLSCSLGLPEQYTNEIFVSAVDEIIQKASNAGKGAGIHVAYGGGLEQEIRWAGMGANLIVHSMDIAAMRSAFRQDFDQLRSAIEGEAGGTALENINI